MSEELRLIEIFGIHKRRIDDGGPAYYEVVGLPNGQKAFVELDGSPEGHWRMRQIPAVGEDAERSFATPDEALVVLKQNMR